MEGAEPLPIFACAFKRHSLADEFYDIDPRADLVGNFGQGGLGLACRNDDRCYDVWLLWP